MTETLPATSASRRSFLRGAAVAGTAVWVVPAVQLIGMDAASAQETSGTQQTQGGTGPVGGDPLQDAKGLLQPLLGTADDLLP